MLAIADMPQFGLSSTNSHWGYGAAGAYSPYFTTSSLGSCSAPTASQFNTPALGFSGSVPEQTPIQDAFGTSSTVSSRKYDDTDHSEVLSLLIKNDQKYDSTSTIFISFSIVSVLPDSSTTDLDQHLGLVSSQTHINHAQTAPHPPSSLLVPRYPTNHSDFAVSGPRSLSDNSSAAESPVQDDLLASQANHANNSNFPLHQNVAPSAYPTSNCNNSLYPVLPASLLYSQLYSAANQTHNFHTIHASHQQHHNDLQSVMDQLSTSNQRSMNGGADLLLSGNASCGAAAARQDEAHARGLSSTVVPQRGPAQSGDAVVWRPY